MAVAQVRLLPAPREAHFSGQTALLQSMVVNVPGHDAEDEFAAQDLENAARPQISIADNSSTAYSVLLLRSGSAKAKDLLAQHHLTLDAQMEDEGYVLAVEPHQAWVVAASSSGIFYGVQTLKQLLPLPGSKQTLPLGTVRDWPAMKYRGIDDDLSRGPFPTLEFQKHQIRIFASYKVNIYSPYIEHTLLYPNQPLAAPPDSALTPVEVAELVQYARQFHVVIVPEQEAFGHLHHVLKYDIYQDVAETPHGHVLAPGQPGTLPLIKDWLTQVAAEFPSPFLHIGADETFDLGVGRTHPQVVAKGYGPVYVDFLLKIHEQLAPLHRRLLFWGDIGGSDPAAVAGLPKDMIAVPWNYWDTKGFDKMIEPFAKAGIETWVAPGDGNWNEVFPVAQSAFGNIQGFIRDGQRLGSTGALTTIWNDDGEGLFNMDWYGTLFGAVAAWQPGESSISAYQDAYGQLFHGDASGKINQAEKELMLAHAALSQSKSGLNSDQLFWLDPWSAEGQEASAKVLPFAVQMRIHAEQAIVLIEQARAANPSLKEVDALTAMDMGARRLDLIGLKFELCQEIAEAYAQVLLRQHDQAHSSEVHNMLDEISSMFGRCQDLRDAYSASKNEYKQVWLSENRPYWLDNVTVRYDLRIEEWQRRGERFATVTRDFEKNKDLPSASALGLPTVTLANKAEANKNEH
ncbi:glycoside hydrolase family 20 zincin-like fold domain-containing protein [Telmatobacter bradus]|uniref:glycoside hydrolase family 20 zincin-like fold domain-containing protein n=1 Tax=Telmatobacter bradus TaxID=474953 RepID=UPI003B43C64E